MSGRAYFARLPAELAPGDTSEDPFGSRAELFEDGVALGPAHAAHEVISERGGGLFSHWQGGLYFSSGDGSDPRSNGRAYQLYVPARRNGLRDRAAALIAALPERFSSADAYAAIERSLAMLYPEAKIGEDGKAFWGETGFIEAYRRLCGENHRPLERKFTVYQLLRSLGHLGGDLAECGAYNGSTAYFMALADREVGARREFFLFDSFEGLSAPQEADGAYWKAGDLTSPEEVARANLAGFNGIHIRRGWIPERFEEVADRAFAFVHVDVDLYQPTLDSIAFFYPRLVPGGMLVCDDYGFTTCPGAMKAMDEFFADKPETVIHLPTGQGLVIKR